MNRSILVTLAALFVIAACVVALPSNGKYSAVIAFMPIEFQITDDVVDRISCLSGCSDQMLSTGSVTVSQQLLEFEIAANGDNQLCNVPQVTISVTEYTTSAGNTVSGIVSMTYDNTTVNLGSKCLVFNQASDTFGVQLISSSCPSVGTTTTPTCSGGLNATSILFTAKLEGEAPIESSESPTVEESVIPRQSANSGSSLVYSVFAIAAVIATMLLSKYSS